MTRPGTPAGDATSDKAGQPELVGRHGEIAVFDRRLAALREGVGVISLAGEPGIGKTRLLLEFSERARQFGAAVLAGGAGGPVDDGPFAGLRALLGQPPQGAEDAVDVALPLAGGLLALAEGSAVTQAVAVRELRSLLVRLAEPAGLVLLIDDVQMMDRASVHVLVSLLRQPPPASLLLVIGYRPRQCDPRLLAALSAAKRAWRTTHLDLTGLGREETDVFAGAALCGRHRATIFEDSGGNPRYLELLMAKCQGELSRSATVYEEQMPTWASAPLLVELVGLPAGMQLVAHTAAVVGDPFEPDLIVHVGQVDRHRTLAAIDGLLARDIIRPGAVSGQFDFRHPLLRQVAYHAAPGGWRLDAHRRAADALRRAGYPVARYAEHVERASCSGDESSVTALIEAAGVTVARAPGVATGWYRAALRLLPGTRVNRSRRRALLGNLVKASGMAGQLAECRSAIEQWNCLVDDGEYGPEAADVAIWSATLAQLDGHRSRVRAILRAALSARGEFDNVGQTTALRLALAGSAMWNAATEESLSWSDDAVHAAAGSGDEFVQSFALGIHATVRLARGDVGIACRGARAAAALADGLTDDRLAGGLELLTCLGWLNTHLERYPEAVRHFARGLSISRSTGQFLVAVPMIIGLGAVYLRQGRLGAASEQAELAVSLSEPTGCAELRTMALCLQAQIALAAFNLDAAHASALAATVAVGEDSPWWRQARMTRAAIQLASGDAVECLTTLTEAGLADGDSLLPLWDHVVLSDLRGRALLAVGRPGDAALAAQQAQTAATVLDLSGQRAVAGLLSAVVCDNAEDALVLAIEAVNAATRCGHQVAAGYAHVVAARAQVARGEHGRVREHLDAAGLIAATSEAHRLASAVAEVRAALGAVADVGPAADGPHVLSQREFEIAQLVSQGQTNRQIARVLEVSQKTVETHLGRIFSKLSVSSRAQIANMVGRAAVVGRSRAGHRQSN